MSTKSRRYEQVSNATVLFALKAPTKLHDRGATSSNTPGNSVPHLSAHIFERKARRRRPFARFSGAIRPKRATSITTYCYYYYYNYCYCYYYYYYVPAPPRRGAPSWRSACCPVPLPCCPLRLAGSRHPITAPGPSTRDRTFSPAAITTSFFYNFQRWMSRLEQR